MRIIAGKFRGRLLSSPANDDIRPTSDRVRESLFSIIASSYADHLKDGRVIDLFAGSGALGLEALSRGAKYCLFVDNSPQAIALIRKNIESLNLQSKSSLMRLDATKLGKAGRIKPFDILFVDPPYGQNLAQQAIPLLQTGGWLKANTVVIIEDNASNPAPSLNGYQMLDQRKYGDSIIHILSLMTKS
ncbi:MAG: 16S rRNA (guanine(966)-N(2))-methyltransferase RsmD [Rhizobiaceae bacterium]|nr:16S rRNA (guanine(966)-N(2))-methyltransferase RsmD [Rhizobiaceae bacterium]